MNHQSIFLLDKHDRAELWQKLISAVEDYTNKVGAARVSPELNPEKVRSLLRPFDFDRTMNPLEAVDFVVQGLWQHQVHTSHPQYFGLFNPSPTVMGVAADTLVAAFNPQLAGWAHNPFAAEIESHLVRAFGSRFGYEPSQTDGTFASGGAEANHTAMLTALVQAFPNFDSGGVRSLEAQPVFYVSQQSHHSFLKAARFCGLGTSAVREIPVNEDTQMEVELLAAQITKDRHDGFAPFMVVATAGTTSGGVLDPIGAIADVAAKEQLWLHVDAAWGGAARLVPELSSLFAGLERADSITIDAHKWLAVPMGAGLYLTRHMDILDRTCHIATDYMPREGAGLDITDPYTHSMQWSRRFTGLKLFLSLAVAGWKGYISIVRHQIAMGELLRDQLKTSKWKIVNKTPLPVVCFVDQENPAGESAHYLEKIVQEVLCSGKAWISTTRLKQNLPVVRACITNYRTEAEDVLAFIDTLNAARQRVRRR